MWIWEMDWWSTLEGIHVAVSPVQELLEKVQADGVSLGRAVESLHGMLDKIAPAVRRIAPGDAVRAAAIVALRGPQFFSPYSTLHSWPIFFTTDAGVRPFPKSFAQTLCCT